MADDGCDEVATGAIGAQSWNGRVYVLLGHGLNCARVNAQVVTLDAGLVTTAFGWSMIGGRDINGDEMPDLVVSAPYAINGAVYLMPLE